MYAGNIFKIMDKELKELLNLPRFPARMVVERNARLILSGDTRQHGAVEAGDALRAIEKHSGIRPVELTNIRRQNPALAKSIEERKHIKECRQAVEEARDGKFTESFERLDKLKAIESCTLADKHEKLTALSGTGEGASIHRGRLAKLERDSPSQ